MAEKVRVLGLISLSFMLAAGFICILIAASRSGDWTMMIVALLSISIPFPGRIGYILMKEDLKKEEEEEEAEDEDQEEEYISSGNDRCASITSSTKTVMIPGLGTLCLLFTPLDNISERNWEIWLGAQILSLALIILSLVVPLFWFLVSTSIGGDAALLSSLGAVLMMGSILLYSHMYHKNEDDLALFLNNDSEDEFSNVGGGTCEISGL